MPSIVWVSLTGLTSPPRVEHVHAAFSRWFDVEGVAAHPDNTKPYRLSPADQRGDDWGVEVSLWSDPARVVLQQHLAAHSHLRLGERTVQAVAGFSLADESWEDLSSWSGETRWRVHFMTPFVARTNSRPSPLPTPPVLLRTPAASWTEHADIPPPPLSREEHRDIWVSDVNLSTARVPLGRHVYPGAVGNVLLQAEGERASRHLAAMLRFAVYCGVGSFRGKGMGVIDLEPVER